jgi:hypothetical protein
LSAVIGRKKFLATFSTIVQIIYREGCVREAQHDGETQIISSDLLTFSGNAAV